MEHTIQTLEDMLGECIIKFKGNSDNICLLCSIHIIIVCIHSFPRIPMKPCMVEGVGLLLDCLKRESLHFLVLI